MSIWDALREELAPLPKEPPPNSVTIEAYAERYGVNLSTAGHQLKRLERAGKLVSGSYCRDGHLVRYYVLP